MYSLVLKLKINAIFHNRKWYVLFFNFLETISLPLQCTSGLVIQDQFFEFTWRQGGHFLSEGERQQN